MSSDQPLAPEEAPAVASVSSQSTAVLSRKDRLKQRTAHIFRGMKEWAVVLALGITLSSAISAMVQTYFHSISRSAETYKTQRKIAINQSLTAERTGGDGSLTDKDLFTKSAEYLRNVAPGTTMDKTDFEAALMELLERKVVVLRRDSKIALVEEKHFAVQPDPNMLKIAEKFAAILEIIELPERLKAELDAAQSPPYRSTFERSDSMKPELFRRLSSIRGGTSAEDLYAALKKDGFVKEDDYERDLGFVEAVQDLLNSGLAQGDIDDRLYSRTDVLPAPAAPMAAPAKAPAPAAPRAIAPAPPPAK
jgi:hypothetical protein